MMAGLRDILIITTPHDQSSFQWLLGDGSQFGLRLSYAVQPKPGGLAQAFLIGKDFIEDDSVALILGDNLFYGHGLPHYLEKAASRTKGATVFSYQVNQPERYGVVSFDKSFKPIKIEEKPRNSKSKWAVTGLYFYDKNVVEIASGLKPSPRGELEITDVNKAYLKSRNLHVERLGRGIAWLDTGTPESLLQASTFIQVLEERQGLKVACPEEIAFKQGFITSDQLERLAKEMKSSAYAEYLIRVLGKEI
jgi:glucose-1-phosphate thymidylyltransferase